MSSRLLILGSALALLAGSALGDAAHAADRGAIQDFKSGSQAQILATHAGQPLAIAFWSLNCAHCPSSLRTLAEFQRRQPGLSVVLVSTDGEVDAASLTRHVRDLGLGNAAQWRFADPLPERLRMEIDPRWWGELPRTLLVDARGQRQSVSGVLTHAALTDWLARAH